MRRTPVHPPAPWFAKRSEATTWPTPALGPAGRMLCVLLLVAAIAPAEVAPGRAGPTSRPADGLIASTEPGWAQWRGPRRDGICDETNLLTAWPAEGPRLVWRAADLGRGWSSPVVSRGRIFLTGDAQRACRIYAFDLDGKRLWTAANGEAWAKSYPGARACCLYDAGRLYHMNAHGRVVCLDANTGREIWAVDTLRRFQGKSITWGHSECLLADGERLIVTPGGANGVMAALDKKTGQTVWTTPAIPGDNASYASPILFAFGGVRQIVQCSSRHAFGVDADTGRLLWTRPRPTRYQAIASAPLYHDGSVVVGSPDGKLAERYALKVAGRDVSVEPVWESAMEEMSGGFIWRDGRLYGSGYRSVRGWAALDWRTGRTLYRLEDLDRGAQVWADGLLYCVSQRGEAALLKPGAESFETRGRFQLVPGEKRPNDCWTHPVICEGRLYLRYHDTLWCYDVRAK